MKKLNFLIFIVLLTTLLLLTLYFDEYPQKKNEVTKVIDSNFGFLQQIRISLNVNFATHDNEIDVENQYELNMYTEIYKKEYEDLMGFQYKLKDFEIGEFYPIAIILRTTGIGRHEKIQIISSKNIFVNSFLVSPKNGIIIGKVEQSSGKNGTVIPFWNDSFTCQVKLESNDGAIEDLALLEKGEVISYNSTTLFKKGDSVFISEFEPSGYSLNRYNWNKIGEILSLVDREIVDHYLIKFPSSREEIMTNRYYLLVR